jgi:hypothetical protein
VQEGAGNTLWSGSNRYRQGLPQQNSSSSATKRKNRQMGFHKIKKLLHNKRNGLPQSERKYFPAVHQTKD